MLTEEWPDEALKSCIDRFRNATVKINGGLVEQVANQIAVMASLQDRRDALASVPAKYQDDIKKRVIELFKNKR